ncbi:bifunctional diaminohydroxyphosphoribosylaminopyrimidine deaminase/5-amino-6-(5-phosphoribosylamino)uracil reductase RibD [Rivihabitans pingtungensis]|uniref:Riboflavin biosynthesis protein RibD n=1 Tax=Rivihabitans pingtungensis TaxID=1054498 RepID=A0A318KKR6_9NEIS|nr:bifunctional diaminohydroxyphosphoribosylaminopyrimidine deaminase/5-amino-6-(5-phosphoribosylamino)uracil reductase RibD [Rivihabitans pingtungensis]PXX76982.1 diaminohydroxyphosphoribosylaminopyrimidine deaminase [Rivihabitans pingtungensis]
MTATFRPEDHAWMAQALRLAAQGLFTTTPNPRVGCVLVRDGQLVGSGWHRRAGEPHAEVHALAEAGAQAAGATAYVTLEPCSHHGRTPPCADALIAAGVSRVVAAMTDPNPLVAGRGLARLAAAGVSAEHGLLAAEAAELNKGFIQRMTQQRPWVTVKLGASLDGKSALSDGRSQWITGPAARADVQRLRARSCAVLTGAGTVMADNPRLTVRDFAVERQPLRVVAEGVMCAGALERAVYQDGGRTVVACALAHPGQRAKLQAQGVTVWELPLANNPGKVDLPMLLAQLAQEYGVNELLVEAGMGVCGALLQADLVDELVIYQAPVTLGHDARGLFDIPPLPNLDVARRWQWHDVAKVGNDLRLTLRR